MHANESWAIQLTEETVKSSPIAECVELQMSTPEREELSQVAEPFSTAYRLLHADSHSC